MIRAHASGPMVTATLLSLAAYTLLLGGGMALSGASWAALMAVLAAGMGL